MYNLVKIIFVASVALMSLPSLSNSEHIVFLHNLVSYSHIVATMPLAQALVKKGHNVTYISPVPSPSPHPNINYVIPKEVKEYVDKIFDDSFDVSTRLEGRMPNLLSIGDTWNLDGCRVLLSSLDFQNWLNSTQPVDLIYVDTFPECAFGIAYKLKAKLAIFLPLPMTPKYFDGFGLPTESSSIPLSTLPFKTPMSFFDRVKTTLEPIGWRFSQLLFWPSMESLMKEYLHLDYLPSLDELQHNISLVLMNGHFLDEHRRSLPPMFVSVPALHVRESGTNQPLPKEIDEFINTKDKKGNPNEGFIYISFGTLAKAPQLPQNIREVFFNSMKAFPSIRFLWRWDGDFPKDKPNNLFLSKWFNQQDVLAHSSIRGFVTQSGRPSSQEAISNAVPMITFPILGGDQDYNADMLESLGVSINLEIGDITEELLKNAFTKIIYDQELKARSIEVSKLYTDLPMKPIETAVWWTEYVLRHKNTAHLKPTAINQFWYQRRLLDVWAFISISVVLFLYLIFTLFRLGFKSIFAKLTEMSKLKEQEKALQRYIKSQ